MRTIIVSDFTIKEVPHGGSEWVNQVLIDKFGCEFWYSNQIVEFDKDAFYIISNISLMHPSVVRQIPSLNYVIMEHDYKICASRHPWRWPDSIVPKNERINYDLYEKAKAIFVQTNDHLRVYKNNDVKGNFISLHSSIWADDDLNLLENMLKTHETKNGKYGIYATNNWIKNTEGAIRYCSENNLQYELIPNQEKREDFLSLLAQCSHLVFFPIARETFCRLVVEAKCMGVDVITTKNYGASLEGWFDLSGQDLIDFLRMQSEDNLNKIKQICGL
jgi:glycosyltransferase involved in cell wall biosynthesis